MFQGKEVGRGQGHVDEDLQMGSWYVFSLDSGNPKILPHSNDGIFPVPGQHIPAVPKVVKTAVDDEASNTVASTEENSQDNGWLFIFFFMSSISSLDVGDAVDSVCPEWRRARPSSLPCE